MGDYGKVAEIRYGKIEATKEKLKALEAQLEDMKAGNRLMKEEVEAEDIAEIVAKWTGIPLSKMLQTEKRQAIAFRKCFTQTYYWAR